MSEDFRTEAQAAYDEGRWCGECMYGVVMDPPCCAQPTPPGRVANPPTPTRGARPPRIGSTAWFTAYTALLTAAVTCLQFLH